MEPLIVDPEKLKKGADYRRLAGLLRLCSVTHVDEQTGYFWPTKLLSRIMTNERVIEALANECRGTPSARADLEVLAEVIHAVIGNTLIALCGADFTIGISQDVCAVTPCLAWRRHCQVH